MRYQEEIKKYDLYPSGFDGLVSGALGVANEGGEVAGVLKKAIRDDNSTLTEEKRTKLKDELGDVLWYIAKCANEAEFTIEELMARNLIKLEDRLHRDKLRGSGDNR